MGRKGKGQRKRPLVLGRPVERSRMPEWRGEMPPVFAGVAGRLRRLSPTHRVLISFVGIILVGALVLELPLSVQPGQPRLPFVDALFMSTSAVCVTGLSTIDVGTRLSSFGQGTLLLLVQLGGLGFLTLSTGLLLSLGERSSMLSRVAVEATVTGVGGRHVPGVLRMVFVSTLTCELIGAAILTTRFAMLDGFDLGKAAWFGVFHAVSAFCNAGFSLFTRAGGDSGDNLMGFMHDPVVNMTIMALIVLGGLGFIVLHDIWDLWRGGRQRRLSLHSRIVLWVSAFLIVVGALLFWVIESDRMFAGQPWYAGLWPAFFQSVSARTAGFNTVDMSALASPTLLLLIVLMFIGGSPASCAGGVKTTTAFVLILLTLCRLRRRLYPAAFGREIALETVARTVTLILTGLFLAMSISAFLLVIEGQRPIGRCSGGIFLDVMFEAVSAFGTVGLSTGITPDLTAPSKYALALAMYIGRLGPLSVFVALAEPPRTDRVRYPEESVIVG